MLLNFCIPTLLKPFHLLIVLQVVILVLWHILNFRICLLRTIKLWRSSLQCTAISPQHLILNRIYLTWFKFWWVWNHSKISWYTSRWYPMCSSNFPRIMLIRFYQGAIFNVWLENLVFNRTLVNKGRFGNVMSMLLLYVLNLLLWQCDSISLIFIIEYVMLFIIVDVVIIKLFFWSAEPLIVSVKMDVSSFFHLIFSIEN